MSYCVNCGVELEKSQRACPLCGTEVINPAEPFTEDERHKRYSRHVERLDARIDRRYVATFLSLLMLIPAFVTMFTNILANGVLSWSLYAVGALLVLFTFTLLPMLLKRRSPYLCVFLDAGATALLLIFIEGMTEKHWFLRLGLPLTVIALLLALLGVFLVSPRRTMEPLVRAAIGVTGVGASVVLIECAIRFYQGTFTWPRWSEYALFPCLVLAAGLLLLNKRARLKSELKRRFYM